MLLRMLAAILGCTLHQVTLTDKGTFADATTAVATWLKRQCSEHSSCKQLSMRFAPQVGKTLLLGSNGADAGTAPADSQKEAGAVRAATTFSPSSWAFLRARR